MSKDPNLDRRNFPRTEVHALRWYPAGMVTAPDAVIGFAALIDRGPGHDPYFKVYVGLAGGSDTQLDAERIARHGAPILDEVMARHLAGPRWKKLRYAR